MDDRELLQAYITHHSDRAFGELVARHLPFVLGTSLRVTRDPHAAADVAQTVFIQLACKAWTIREGQALSGWLYRVTHHTALKTLRSDQRRRDRETITMKLAETPTTPAPGWDDLAPLVDEAIQQLKLGEQDALMLRFFEDKSYGEVGRILGLDEKTACQRVNRALEKMRGYFSRRGVTTTAALLGAALTSHAAASAPVGMAANITGASLAGASGSGALSGFLLKSYLMTFTTKAAILAAVLIAAGFASVLIRDPRANRQSTTKLAASQRVVSVPGSASTAPRSVASLKSLREQEWQQFLALLDNRSQVGMLQAFFKLQNQMAENDSEGIPFMLERTAGLPPGSTRDFGLEHFFIQLLSYNPPRPLGIELTREFAIAASISDPKIRETTNNRILSYLTRSNPEQAVVELAKLPPGPLAQSAYHSVFSTWAAADSTNGAAAASVAFKLPAGAERTQAMIGVVNGWIGNKAHPDLNITRDALNWASSLPPADLNTVLNDGLYPASKQAPALAAQFVGKLTDASVRNAAIQSVARIWAVPVFPGEMPHQDPAAALDWLDQVATGDNYDTNVEYIFSKLDPATASTLIGKVTEPVVRESVIASVATAWGKKDPSSAIAWLQTLPAADGPTRDPLVQKLGRPANTGRP